MSKDEYSLRAWRNGFTMIIGPIKLVTFCGVLRGLKQYGGVTLKLYSLGAKSLSLWVITGGTLVLFDRCIDCSAPRTILPPVHTFN